MINVSAALIWKNGRFMICQRPANKTRAFLWEFAGGKAEPGETGEHALVRECKEELDITVRVKNEFMSVIYEYPDVTVKLTVFEADIAYGEIKLIEHKDLKWITPAEIDNFDFCPADTEILEKIKKEYNKAR